MAIVKEFMLGNTHVAFSDDGYRDKTPDELKRAHKRMCQEAYNILVTAELAKLEQEKAK